MSRSANTYKNGLIAEIVAAIYLMMKGYTILRWRARTPVGEIDLIAAKGGAVIFIEVKTRKKGEDALYAVHPRNQNRVTRAALYLMAGHPAWQNRALRFDIIALSWPFFIRHIDNAWRPRA